MGWNMLHCWQNLHSAACRGKLQGFSSMQVGASKHQLWLRGVARHGVSLQLKFSWQRMLT
jgi:hypothetical protein